VDSLLNAETHLSEQIKLLKNEEILQHRHPASPKIKTWCP